MQRMVASKSHAAAMHIIVMEKRDPLEATPTKLRKRCTVGASHVHKKHVTATFQPISVILTWESFAGMAEGKDDNVEPWLCESPWPDSGA